ncbi:Zn-ribbon domain-containing protein [Haloplanus halobius]|uniref:Zn-ribbon domain-containing protein n=1 Tax=Haloplanus halobius TaxID=2934938 RepID=UPI00200F8F41|nr:Zn-ribbon domain-containing protein [Haloplanus sp. XH21]
MPHQCTNCERVFADGSKEMLSGCPDCGGNKFQFKPDSATETPTLGEDDSSTADTPSSSTADTSPSTSASTTSSSPTPSATDSSAASSAADSAASSPPPDSTDDEDFIEAESDPSVFGEDTAQADARRSVVTRDELDDVADPADVPTEDGAPAQSPASADAPGIEDLREELNDQFESIKILEPGQYELNLMELYDRQECIISLQEDGHYVIEVADAWRDDG